MRSHSVIYLAICVAVGSFVLMSCGRQQNASVPALPSFSVSNGETVGGGKRQVISVTNGMSLYFTESNLVVAFNNEGAAIIVEFDPQSLNPTQIELSTAPFEGQPAQDVLDVNADGIPDVRRLRDQAQETKQIFYCGKWYLRSEKGSKFISVNGRDIKVRFDGRRWVEADDTDSSNETGQ